MFGLHCFFILCIKTGIHKRFTPPEPLLKRLYYKLSLYLDFTVLHLLDPRKYFDHQIHFSLFEQGRIVSQFKI